MFSNEPRCRYGQPQLVEVICQLRFPEILTIQANAPADFQEAIRSQYPLYLRRQEIPAAAVSGNMTLLKKEPVINHQFATADGVWRINLTSKFISLACSKYTCWEEFAAHLEKLGAEHRFDHRPGTHSWDFWDQSLQDCFAYLFE